MHSWVLSCFMLPINIQIYLICYLLMDIADLSRHRSFHLTGLLDSSVYNLLWLKDCPSPSLLLISIIFSKVLECRLMRTLLLKAILWDIFVLFCVQTLMNGPLNLCYSSKFSFYIFRWINRHLMLKCSYAHIVQSYPVWVYAHLLISPKL